MAKKKKNAKGNELRHVWGHAKNGRKIRVKENKM